MVLKLPHDPLALWAKGSLRCLVLRIVWISRVACIAAYISLHHLTLSMPNGTNCVEWLKQGIQHRVVSSTALLCLVTMSKFKTGAG